MITYIDPEWREFLETHGLSDFDGFWSRQDPWFEEPNFGRSKKGWSGVSRVEVGGRTVFIKKQENFLTRSWRRPLGMSLAEREFANIQDFASLSIPAMKVVFFGVRKQAGNLQAVIATEALEDYMPLDEVFGAWKTTAPPRHFKNQLILALAELVRMAHAQGRMHFNLYPKHIFVHKQVLHNAFPQQAPVCRFIDLETARKAAPGSRKQLRDLDTLDRRSKYGSRCDRLRFMLGYMNKQQVDSEVRAFLRRLGQYQKKR